MEKEDKHFTEDGCRIIHAWDEWEILWCYVRRLFETHTRWKQGKSSLNQFSKRKDELHDAFMKILKRTAGCQIR